jgi:ketosteroid isomerase-like protein
MRIVAILLLALLFVGGCNEQPSPDQAREQLMQVDREFSAMSVAVGARKAFEAYIGEGATVFRNNAMPFTGKEEILPLYDNLGGGTLEWEPYFADVSATDDLGYTLGQWDYTAHDSTGAEQTASGYYVTIWKRQADGSWKFVFDTGTDGPQSDEE